MSVSYRIFPNRGLVYVRYEGDAVVSDRAIAFADYMAHPDCRPGQNQLVDLSRVTSIESDYAQMMELQAKKTEMFATGGSETLVIYYAPSPLTQKLARILERPWEVVPGVIPIIVQTEEEALSILGQREKGFGDLLAGVA